jgi:hypothetical protein
MLERLFDSCYERAERLNRDKGSALCDIRDGHCARSRNTGANPFCCGAHVDFPGNQRCQHLGHEGCTIKSLRCKLWFCESIRCSTVLKKVSPGSISGFRTARMTSVQSLVDEASFYGFLVHRGDRAQSLVQAATKWAVPIRQGG